MKKYKKITAYSVKFVEIICGKKINWEMLAFSEKQLADTLNTIAYDYNAISVKVKKITLKEEI